MERSDESGARFAFEVFFDGACPICRREIAFLRARDARRVIRFTDITSDDFDPRSLGKSHDELMARIHGRLPDGRVLEGVDVFRALYDAAGFSTLVRASRLPIVRDALEVAYRAFAANRLRLTGRCSDETCSVPSARRDDG